ncbi:MAG: DNA mismatch repair protein MutT [Amaricoccus sp.]
MADTVPIRDAATIILLRRDGGVPRVLMGQRGAGAAFMPDKFVFPGGALDPGDVSLAARLALAEPEPALGDRCAVEVARGLPLAALRELWEETGLLLGRPDPAVAAGLAGLADWLGFHRAGLAPDPGALRLFFRAVTPPGRPRRFDARFFLADAGALAGDPDDFSGASGELSYLRWVELAAARALPLPFITEIVLAELEAMAAEPDGPRPVPFFEHSGGGSQIHLLRS